MPWVLITQHLACLHLWLPGPSIRTLVTALLWSGWVLAVILTAEACQCNLQIRARRGSSTVSVGISCKDFLTAGLWQALLNTCRVALKGFQLLLKLHKFPCPCKGHLCWPHGWRHWSPVKEQLEFVNVNRVTQFPCPHSQQWHNWVQLIIPKTLSLREREIISQINFGKMIRGQK